MFFRKGLLVFLAIVFFQVAVLSQSIDDLEIMTEDFPPFNYGKTGAAKGIAVDLMVEILKDVGAKQNRKNIKVLPWARSYKMLQNKKNTLLFLTTRTEERERKFTWVGPVIASKTVLIALKSKNIKIKNKADLKKYKIGAVRQDVGEQLVISAGYPKSKVNSVAKADIAARMLDKERIDLWAYEESVAKWKLKSLGLSPGKFQTVYVLKKSQMYYSLNKKTSKAISSKLQKSLNKLKKKGVVKKIIKKYLR